MTAKEIKVETINFWSRKALFSKSQEERYDAMVKLLNEIDEAVDKDMMTPDEQTLLTSALDECRQWIYDNPKNRDEDEDDWTLGLF